MDAIGGGAQDGIVEKGDSAQWVPLDRVGPDQNEKKADEGKVVCDENLHDDGRGLWRQSDDRPEPALSWGMSIKTREEPELNSCGCQQPSTCCWSERGTELAVRELQSAQLSKSADGR